MNPKVVTDKGFKFYEGSEVIQISDFAVIFEHKKSKRIISYLTQNKTMVHNIVSQNEEDHNDALRETMAQLKIDSEKHFLSKVQHSFRVNDILVAHENIKSSEKDFVHFYQVIAIKKGAQIEVMEIEVETLEFNNHFKAIPSVGLQKENTEKFHVDVVKNSINTPEGFLAFQAKYNIHKVGNILEIKVYEPTNYGLVI